MSKENYKFGHGSFVGQLMSDEDYPDMSDQQLAEVVGWVAGCPIVKELTSPDSGRGGPEAMAHRYGELNFWFQMLAERTAKINPRLKYLFSVPENRARGEHIGKHESNSVPVSFRHEMPPMATLVGYALPRLFVEQIGSQRNDLTPLEKQDRLARGLELFDDALENSDEENELLAYLAEDIAAAGDVTTIDVLKRVLSKGWYEENHATSNLKQFKSVLKEKAPELWAVYENLSEEEKIKSNLV